MKLKTVFEYLLKEEEESEIDDLDPVTSDEDNIIEVPSSNFVISLFPNTKTLLFSPQEHTSVTKQVRTLINDLKQEYSVDSVVMKGANAFEVKFDAREDFDAVVDFIKSQVSEVEDSI